jgi:hypothetical protein
MNIQTQDLDIVLPNLMPYIDDSVIFSWCLINGEILR